MAKSMPLVLGADLYRLIGEVVTLDVQFTEGSQEKKAFVSRHPERLLMTGVLTAAKDAYRGDEVTCTYLVIGGLSIDMDWDDVESAVVRHMNEAN